MIALLLAAAIVTFDEPKRIPIAKVEVEHVSVPLHIRESIRITPQAERIPTRLTPIWERVPPPMPTVTEAVVIEASEVYLTIAPHRCLGVIGDGEIVSIEVPETGDGYVVARFEKDGRVWRFFVRRNKLEVLK